MNKKAVALLTAIAFLVPFEACLSVKKDVKTDPGSVAGAPPYKTTVVAVQTKAGERLAFPRGSRATIAGDRLLIPEGRTSGHYVMLRNRYPKGSLRNVIKDSRGRIVEVTLSDGRVLKVRGEVQEDKDALVLTGLTYRSVPLADIDLVWIKKTDRMSSMVASTLMWGGGLTLVVLALTSGHERSPSPPPEESCPFVYSFDGKEYVLDAEPYGGSVCPGLERADWIGLDNLRPVGGLYRLRLSNELDEVEHIDELKLVIADHPVGVEVFPELSGRLRTAAAPLPPASARDAGGRDILPLVGAKDQTFWLGRVEGRDPDRLEDLKEELVFEFVKPSGARQAKLIANAWTTRWGSQAIRPLLASQGRALRPYLEKVGRGGAPLLSLLGWFAREEMYNLQVRVETASGWTTKALVHGGGPMVAKDKVYPLDVSDVAGDKVRIKLTPAAGFWMIDRLAVDFSDDLPVRAVEIAALSARDALGRDVRPELASDDGSYFVVPKGSGPAELAFAAPPRPRGTARTVFVKARGYYDILLDADGEPTLDLERMMDSPGESLRFVLRNHPALARPAPADR